jgi:hypothetical protein
LKDLQDLGHEHTHRLLSAACRCSE